MTATVTSSVKVRPHAAAAPLAGALPDTDDVIDDDEGPAGAPSVLGVEPLAAEEIELFTAKDHSMNEQREGELAVLRKSAELKLPVDPDAGDAHVVAADEELDVRVRPNKRR